MKTFRLVSLHLLLLENGQVINTPVPLKDGLIINREESDGSWLVEAVVSSQKKSFFQQMLDYDELCVLKVVITDKNNDPAIMSAKVRTITELSKEISVLFDASMMLGKEEVSSLILEELIADGLTGEELIKEFTHRKEDQVEWPIKIAEKIYRENE